MGGKTVPRRPQRGAETSQRGSGRREEDAPVGRPVRSLVGIEVMQQQVVVPFDELEPPCGTSPVWDLYDEDGVAVLDGEDLEDCGFAEGTEETVTLQKGGTYKLRVRTPLDLPRTGPYSFRLVEQ